MGPQLSRRTLLTSVAATAVIGHVTLGAGARPAAAAPMPDAPLSALEAIGLTLSPPVYLLETAVPAAFAAERGTLAISGERAKLGAASLKWDHERSGALRINGPIGWQQAPYKAGDDQAWMGKVPTFAMWVYNDVASSEPLRVEFGRGGRVDTAFDFGLDFTGWRTMWVRYGYDTTGTPRPDMDTITFRAPARVGTLYLDQVIVNAPMRPDHPTPDHQVPGVQPEIDLADNYHWLALNAFEQDLARRGLPTPVITDALRADLATLRARHLATNQGGPKPTAAMLTQYAADVAALGVPELTTREGRLVPARPGAFVDGYQTAIFPPELSKELKAGTTPLRNYTDKMFQIARAHEQARRLGLPQADAFGQLWLRCFVHLRDQGFAAGSAQGTIHHIGYQHRGWWDSLVLVRPVLEEAGLWQDARADLAWFVGLGRLLQDFENPDHYGGLVDVLNTLLLGLVTAALLMPTEREQITYLDALRRWCDRAITYSPGVQGGFKPDGSMFHHVGMFADYGRDGLIGSAPVIGLLAGTAYQVGPDARAIIRQALLTMRAYANTTQWPLPLSGRNPNGLTGLNINTYGVLANASLPDGRALDADLGRAYLRLLPANPTAAQKALAAPLLSAGLTAEPAPTGHWSINYGVVGLHRRGEWLATIRGHHRYHWATEIYDGANLYGRYNSYCSIWLQSRQASDGTITNEANGYAQPGWDWNRWPGTTTRQLPFEELKADLTGTIEQMVLSESSFAGSGSLEGRHGVFGMDLREHPNFDPSHRARTSVFCFDDRLVVLGSDIHNDDRRHVTQTTLFQDLLIAGLDPTWDSAHGTASGPLERVETLAEARVLVDAVGHGYYVPAGQRLVQQRRSVEAPDQTGTKSAAVPSAVAVLDHGSAPRGAGYEYAILVEAGQAGAAAFAASMRGERPAYTVLRKDAAAHIVADRATGVTGYVLFEKGQQLPGPVRGVNQPCLVMVREDGDELIVSVTDPDLRFSSGRDHDQYERGRYVGKMTSYSRPWRNSPSKASHVVLKLAEKWRVVSGPSTGNGVGALQVTCVDGRPVELRLRRA